MNILGINASPRKENGASEILLNSVIVGVEKTRNIVEKIYLYNLTINNCIGCFTCWDKTPGKCIFNDDMCQLLDKIKIADIIIFSTPLFHFSVTSKLKTMMERRMPLGLPFLINRNGLTGHPSRNNHIQKWVIMSSCAFSEYDNFSSLDILFEQNANAVGAEIIGKIYRTQSEVMISNKKIFSNYLAACELFGEEIIKDGRSSIKTQKIISKEMVFPKNLYNFVGNRRWRKRIDDAKRYTP